MSVSIMDEIRETEYLLANVTNGYWVTTSNNRESFHRVMCGGVQVAAAASVYDAMFISHAHDVMPRLLTEIARLKSLLQEQSMVRKEMEVKKIISLFQRNYDGDRLVRDEVVPGAEWVLAGEGVATRKWDGTCCLVRGGRLYKRYDAKKGKTPPANFEPAQPEADPVSGHWPGWLPVGDGPEDQYHREAWAYFSGEDGTYELIGPKIQGGIEREPHHILRPHGADVLDWCPRDFDGLRIFLADGAYEGIVWHHPDGRMVKIKGKDFGHRRQTMMAAV